MVDHEAVGQVFLRLLGSSPYIIIPLMVHSGISLISQPHVVTLAT